MFSREELLAQARRRYLEYLRAIVEGAPFFPLEMRVGKTRRAATYAERAVELKEFRAAAAELGITVEWSTVNDPRFGPHERPDRAFFAEEATFLSALGRADEVRAFRDDLGLIHSECPALELWLAGNVRAIVEHHGIWPKLLRCVRWFREHPRSGLYLRQIPVAGVDTKFFERRRGILHALLLQTQPETVDLTTQEFEARHGLRREEPLVRIRFLDPVLQTAHGFPVPDLALPAPTFRVLPMRCAAVVVTENLRNFLALPPLTGAVAVFGAGDAAALLADAPWLAATRILYWGDMDARGFAILARLRAAYPAVESVMMDVATLDAHREVVVQVDPFVAAFPDLHPEEQAALDWIGDKGLWLEQERVPFAAVVAAFALLLKSERPS